MIAEVHDLTRQDYELIRRLVYAKSGINLGDQKMQLVRARLGKRVRQGGSSPFANTTATRNKIPRGRNCALSWTPSRPMPRICFGKSATLVSCER